MGKGIFPAMQESMGDAPKPKPKPREPVHVLDVLHFNLLKNQAEYYMPPVSVNREVGYRVGVCRVVCVGSPNLSVTL